MYRLLIADDETVTNNNCPPNGGTDIAVVLKDLGTIENYCRLARSAVIRDILTGTADLSRLDLGAMHLEADIYQIVICEQYGHSRQDASYRFADLLRVTNQDNNSYDNVTIDGNELLLLKGSFAIHKFDEFLNRYEKGKRPQKNSPLDSLFIIYGQCVSSLADISQSYRELCILCNRRFFCAPGQHTISREYLPVLQENPIVLNDEFLSDYAKKLLDYLQVFNRNAIAELLDRLSAQLSEASVSVSDIKLFLTDLYLQIRERLRRLYGSAAVPFAGNGEIIRLISQKYYLYEIFTYFNEQFELIMSSLGNFTRDSVLDDIEHYINHNYADNITLENLAPLFGYNSSYLGKIFSQKIGISFNAYLDRIRMERAKELLSSESTRIYLIAKQVGYRNVDYFHIKFKKYVGMSPAEYRRQARNAPAPEHPPVADS